MTEATTTTSESWPQLERRSVERLSLDSHYDAIQDVQKRLDSGDKRMNGLDEAVKENTKITEEIKADTQEIVEMFKSWAGAIKTLEQIGKIARPLSYVVMLFGSIWSSVTVFKSGGIK